MDKTLLIIYAGTESHADMARVTNALTMAKEFDQAGIEVELAFDGAGVQWLEEFERGHDLASLYEEVEHLVASACDFCADAFETDVDEDLREGSFEGHQSFAPYVKDGWQIITF